MKIMIYKFKRLKNYRNKIQNFKVSLKIILNRKQNSKIENNIIIKNKLKMIK